MKYPKNKLFEQLADIEHQRWSDWQKWVHRTGSFNDNGSITISRENVERWSIQFNTEYKDLSEEEKNSDREQVMRYWDLITTNTC